MEQLALDDMKVMDVADAANHIDNAEADGMFDVVDSFFHVINIVKFWIFVNVNSKYFVFRITRQDLFGKVYKERKCN